MCGGSESLVHHAGLAEVPARHNTSMWPPPLPTDTHRPMNETFRQLVLLGHEVFPSDALSVRSGIPSPLLQAARQGDFRAWDTAMVDRLSNLLGVDPALVWAGGDLLVPNLLAFLRDRWGGLIAEDSLVLRRALTQAMALHEAGWHPEIRYSPKPAPHAQAWKAGYTLARRVRRDLGLPVEPIMDFRGCVEGRLGVLVCEVPLITPGLEALAVAGAAAAAILLNTRMPIDPLKQRRSVAHELGHLLFDPRNQGTIVDALKTEGGEDRDASERHEQRARAFAAELLVPGPALERLFVDSTLLPDQAATRARQVCSKFGAPWELVVRHLRNHGKIDDTMVEPLLHAPERPASNLALGSPTALLWARCQVEEGEISASRMRDIFGLDWGVPLEG